MKIKIALIISLCLLIPVTTVAQKKIRKIAITGKVIDSNGSPLEGVSIFVDNLKTNSTTKHDGTYRIRISPSAKTIAAFSFDHGGQILAFDNQDELNFILNKEFIPEGLKAREAGEIVDVGYMMSRKEDLTTSVGSVNMERVEKRHYNNIYDMIKGEVPGVDVRGNSIIIRGISSMRLSSQPLFVVDGSPTNSVENINPSDVESINVLKGASASIYGSRGSNGVIVIRSKTYKKEKKN